MLLNGKLVEQSEYFFFPFVSFKVFVCVNSKFGKSDQIKKLKKHIIESFMQINS